MIRWTLLFLLLATTASCDKPSTTPSGGFTAFAKEAEMLPSQSNQLAPDFSYSTLSGQQKKLSESQGNIVFLNFWATWCYPCKKEMPDIDKLQAHMKGKAFQLIAISAGEGVEKVVPFTKKFPYPFDFALDPMSNISQLYQIDALPTTLILDKQGRILAKAVGPRQWASPAFMAQMDELVK